MFRPRWYKVLSDLWGNKARSLLVVSSITVGLFAVGMITSMRVILREDMSAGYRSYNPANIQVTASYFDDDLLKRIENIQGVRQTEGISEFNLQVDVGNGVWNQLDMTAVPDIEEMEIGKVRLEQGVWPPREREIVIERNKFDELNANLGDTITVEMWSGKTRDLRIVGVVQDQTIGATKPGGFFMSGIQGYVDLETLEWLEQPELMNTLKLTVYEGKDDPDNLQNLLDRVVYEIEDTGRTVYSTAMRASDDHPNRVYVEALTGVLYLLAFLIVFLSGFLITNTLSALLNQQVAQIGVMKTIGARRTQIILVYMVLIFIYSMIAFLIAAPTSSKFAYDTLYLFAGPVNLELQGFRFVPFSILVQFAIALIVPQLAGYLPILRGTNISAVEAFNSSGLSTQSGQSSWFDRLLKRIRRLPRPQLISIRNTFRDKSRLALTIVTLTLGGAIFIATFNVHASLSEHVERIEKYFLADVNLTLGRAYRIAEVEKVLEDVPGIGEIEGWAAAGSELVMPDGSVGESITLLGPPAESKLIEPVMFEGRWVKPGDQNAITVSERFLEVFPDLQVGDTLTIHVAGDDEEFVVVGIFQLSGKSGGFLAYSTYEYLSGLTHTKNQANTYRIISTSEELTLAQQTELGKEIENRLKERGFSIVDISEGKSLISKTSDGLNTLLIILLILASLTAIVGSIGLTGTMSLNVLERTREIGIMRSIGATDRILIGLVIVEGMIIGLLSWVFGALLAFPISTLLANTINLALFGALTQAAFTPVGVVIWLAVVLLLSVLASVLPARSAARLTIREVLSYE